MSLSTWRQYHGGTCEACGADLTHDTAECPTLCCSTIDARTDQLLEEQHPWGLPEGWPA